jgi:hypothetical protein
MYASCEIAMSEVVAISYAEAPPTLVASSPSQRAVEPVSARQVAGVLPKVTALVFWSIEIAAVVEVANVEGDEVAR